MALLARALVASVTALVAAGLTAPPVQAAQGDVATAEAAVRNAQRQASAASKGLQAAEAALDDAEDDVKQGQADLAAARVALNEASAVVRTAAVREYTNGRAASSVMRSDDIAQISRSRAYLGVANGASTQQVDQLRARASDLDAREKALERRVKAQRRKLAAFQRLETQLASSLEKLGDQLDAARRREAEAKAAAAAAQEAAEKARLEGIARAAEEDRKRLEAARDNESRSARASTPSGPLAAPVNKGPWVCPVAGGATFTNDYGFPRSGGRRHQGNDLFAPRGTPVVASVSGSYRRSSNGLGGISYYLQGEDGNTYYGTHMSGYGPVPPGRVGQGAVLGFVGNTGNARGTSPHLHFEIHPGGGGAVNPYPTVVRAC